VGLSRGEKLGMSGLRKVQRGAKLKLEKGSCKSKVRGVDPFPQLVGGGEAKYKVYLEKRARYKKSSVPEVLGTTIKN
jgi:hypothetical protein